MAGLILLTGASGYIGSRLLRMLEEGGCAVRCLARQPARVVTRRTTTEVVSGDCLDEAFAKLPAGTLENLLKPENKAMLRRVLTYHVVPGKVTAADVVKVSSAKAVSGDTLSIKANGGAVTVNNSKVVKTDIAASNGVIHVVDAVLLPPSE